jgi:hypothetical protein
MKNIFSLPCFNFTGKVAFEIMLIFTVMHKSTGYWNLNKSFSCSVHPFLLRFLRPLPFKLSHFTHLSVRAGYIFIFFPIFSSNTHTHIYIDRSKKFIEPKEIR